jgi:hypothetical protein
LTTYSVCIITHEAGVFTLKILAADMTGVGEIFATSADENTGTSTKKEFGLKIKTITIPAPRTYRVT